MREHSRCPLCSDGGNVWRGVAPIGAYITCLTCGLTTLYSMNDDAWGLWEQLVAKFPIGMRIHVGDTIEYNSSRFEIKAKQGQVVEKNEHSSVFTMKDGTRITTLRIIKYPWELEQEGAEE